MVVMFGMRKEDTSIISNCDLEFYKLIVSSCSSSAATFICNISSCATECIIVDFNIQNEL